MAKKIVVGLDGSKCSEKALEYATQLAEKLGSTLVLINVVPQAPYTQGDFYYGEKIQAAAQKDCEQVLVRQQEQLKARGITSELVCMTGSPADKIVELSEKVEADAIVVGSRGLSSIKSLLLGSVANAVAQKAKRTVIIVK